MTDTTPTAKSKRFNKPRRHYAAIFSTAIAFLANATAITGLLLSHAGILIITAGVLAVLGGLYLLLRCWGKPVNLYTLFTVAILVAGSVVLTLALQAHSQSNQPGPDREVSSSTEADEAKPDSRQADGKPVAKKTSHSVILEKEFTIRATEGLNLDDEKGTLLLQQNQAKAPADLYLSPYALFYTSTKTFFDYMPTTRPSGNTEKDEYTVCANLTSGQGDPFNFIGSSDVIPGKQYCILTTQGRVALLTMKEMIDAGTGSNQSHISFTAKVWD